jgi:hypothetical protein
MTFDDAVALVLADETAAAYSLVLMRARGSVVGVELWVVVSWRDDPEDDVAGEPWRLLYSAGLFGSSEGEEDVIFPEDVGPDHEARSLRFERGPLRQLEDLIDSTAEYQVAKLMHYRGDPDDLARDRAFLAELERVWG